jgi:hypothetical protein
MSIYLKLLKKDKNNTILDLLNFNDLLYENDEIIVDDNQDFNDDFYEDFYEDDTIYYL